LRNVRQLIIINIIYKQKFTIEAGFSGRGAAGAAIALMEDTDFSQKGDLSARFDIATDIASIPHLSRDRSHIFSVGGNVIETTIDPILYADPPRTR
jgi:hypothetical protein